MRPTGLLNGKYTTLNKITANKDSYVQRLQTKLCYWSSNFVSISKSPSSSYEEAKLIEKISGRTYGSWKKCLKDEFIPYSFNNSKPLFLPRFLHLMAPKESIMPNTLWIQVFSDNFYLGYKTWYHNGSGEYPNF